MSHPISPANVPSNFYDRTRSLSVRVVHVVEFEIFVAQHENLSLASTRHTGNQVADKGPIFHREVSPFQRQSVVPVRPELLDVDARRRKNGSPICCLKQGCGRSV